MHKTNAATIDAMQTDKVAHNTGPMVVCIVTALFFARVGFNFLKQVGALQMAVTVLLTALVVKAFTSAMDGPSNTHRRRRSTRQERHERSSRRRDRERRRLDMDICDGLRTGTDHLLEDLWEFCDENPKKMARNIDQLKGHSQTEVKEELERMEGLYHGLTKQLKARGINPLLFMGRYLVAVANSRMCRAGTYLRESVLGCKAIVKDLYNETLESLKKDRADPLPASAVSTRTWTDVTARPRASQTEVSVLPSESVSNIYVQQEYADRRPRQRRKARGRGSGRESGRESGRDRLSAGEVPLTRHAVEALPEGSEEEGEEDDGRRHGRGQYQHYEQTRGHNETLYADQRSQRRSNHRGSGPHDPDVRSEAPLSMGPLASQSMAPPRSFADHREAYGGHRRRTHVGPKPKAPRTVPVGASQVSYRPLAAAAAASKGAHEISRPTNIPREPSLRVHRTPSRLSRSFRSVEQQQQQQQQSYVQDPPPVVLERAQSDYDSSHHFVAGEDKNAGGEDRSVRVLDATSRQQQEEHQSSDSAVPHISIPLQRPSRSDWGDDFAGDSAFTQQQQQQQQQPPDWERRYADDSAYIARADEQ
jgi:hypothetical protein